MAVSYAPGSPAGVLTITGDFVGSLHGGELRTAIDARRSAGEDFLVLDLREAALMDSAGLGVLIEAERALRDAGGGLRLVVRPGRLARLIEVTGLLGAVFEVFDTPEAAIADWLDHVPAQAFD